MSDQESRKVCSTSPFSPLVALLALDRSTPIALLLPGDDAHDEVCSGDEKAMVAKLLENRLLNKCRDVVEIVNSTRSINATTPNLGAADGRVLVLERWREHFLEEFGRLIIFTPRKSGRQFKEFSLVSIAACERQISCTI